MSGSSLFPSAIRSSRMLVISDVVSMIYSQLISSNVPFIIVDGGYIFVLVDGPASR